MFFFSSSGHQFCFFPDQFFGEGFKLPNLTKLVKKKGGGVRTFITVARVIKHGPSRREALVDGASSDRFYVLARASGRWSCLAGLYLVYTTYFWLDTQNIPGGKITTLYVIYCRTQKAFGHKNKIPGV